jgi:hypothetical protein
VRVVQLPLLLFPYQQIAEKLGSGSCYRSIEAATAENPAWPISTWGGGSGLTVIYGVAAPVKPPRIGQVQTY